MAANAKTAICAKAGDRKAELAHRIRGKLNKIYRRFQSSLRLWECRRKLVFANDTPVKTAKDSEPLLGETRFDAVDHCRRRH